MHPSLASGARGETISATSSRPTGGGVNRTDFDKAARSRSALVRVPQTQTVFKNLDLGATDQFLH